MKEALISMRDSMIHGGPDGFGMFISEDKKIGFANRRLAVLDLSEAGHQPMSNHDKTIWITYNGEIYNFQELRNELIDLGYPFKSKTDTEVLIYGYEEWGIDELLKRLQGMFAFALYDKRNNESGYRLILARDRFGIKPLYYYEDKNRLIFASEVKGIIKSMLVPDEKNIEALVYFLQLGSVPSPLTTIRKIFSLPCGSYMDIKEGGRSIGIKKYYDIEDYINNSTDKNEINDYGEILAKIKSLLSKSVKGHLISDVPTGIFLSGGLDSSSLVALASHCSSTPITTLSVVFEEKNYNEAKYARLVAEQYKTDHKEILLKEKDFLNEIPNILKVMDQPTIDGINTYFISKAAKKTGLKVVLSGIGSDEIFLGYSHFKRAKLLNKILPFMSLGLINSLISISKLFNSRRFEKLSYLNVVNSENCYLLFRGLFTPLQIQDLLGVSQEQYCELMGSHLLCGGKLNGKLISTFNKLEFNHYLQNQILKDSDCMSMANSIELRVPYLDHLLVEYVTGLSSGLKLDSEVNKPLLVNLMSEFLPKEILCRNKMGFIFPLKEWINNGSEYFLSICLQQGYFEQSALKKIWNEFKNNKLHWSRVWALVIANKWTESALSKT
ncbi:MAG: asparagine synthase (glutamine-hydrolyzing) [Candidatus Melainabacteria bacterium RIFCSPLOWO2_02_FULL_35_15]|nr:MAG: asparagine synthase (glutamine-hydrolyzing) [Candidatus Melainabacteria bacterium RIFCSPLOWO2_12_FULL_35_11]OGI14581.1 MAG: asparagine synthase (glutamine-hydrolyzing) [Candidatus Melainabacteria bacterium RIFCSPLOWO2_02_FULL_35_15]